MRLVTVRVLVVLYCVLLGPAIALAQTSSIGSKYRNHWGIAATIPPEAANVSF